MRSVESDVLVVGAGTTGMTLALQAHAHGARVRVVERRRDRFRPSRALMVHPRALELLRPLGVTDALLERAGPPAVQLHLGRREVVATFEDLAFADSAFPHLLIEAQAHVEAVLGDALRARGVEVERGTEVVGVRHDIDGPVVHLVHGRDDETAVPRFVVGCDGSASTVRRSVDIGWRGKSYPQEVVLADVELDGDLDRDAAHGAPAPGGVVLLFPVGERAPWRLLSTRRAVGEAGPPGQPGGPVPRDELQALIDRAGISARITGVAWSARVALERRLATSFRSGPVFLAGDAAHVHSPAGGQGMNTGIQDAANLGWKLAFAASAAAGAGSVPPDALLGSYEAERRPAAREVLALTHLLFWGEAGTGPVASLVRRRIAPAAGAVLPLLLRQRRVLATGMRALSQLHVRYRHSPISFEGAPPPRHGSAAGTRLADEPVDVQGRRRQLHELLAVPGVHLLLEDRAARALNELRGDHVRLHRIESWPGRGVIAVRPDGHVGYRSAVADVRDVQRWLATLGLALFGPETR